MDQTSACGPPQGEATADRSRVDPELAAVLAVMANPPPLDDVEGVRRHSRETIAALPFPPEHGRVTTTDRLIPGPPGAAQVPVRVYTPTARSEPTPGLL